MSTMGLEEKIELSKFIIAHVLEKYEKVFASCSFGKDSRVIIDLAMQVSPDMRFIGIDTGYEFPETLQFADRLIKELSMNFEWVRAPKEEREKIESYYGDEFIKEGKYKCCSMKLPAIQQSLEKHDAWISGLRRNESNYRKSIPIVDEKEGIVKINPIAFWTVDDVWNYIRSKKLSYHPLYDEGYASLGCEPCTEKPRQDGGEASERSGRFMESDDDKKECGLHT